jgi:hypothetical protein
MSEHARKSNLEALKAAFDNHKAGYSVNGGGFKFWKPIKYGDYVVRFLPPYNENGFFFKEAAQHKIGDQYVFCPKVEGDDCPICEVYKSLYREGSDAAIELAKEIKPRKQYLYNVIVRSELGEPADQTKVQTFMSGKILYESIMNFFFDEEYGDLTDVDNGYDFVIRKEEGDMGFPNYRNSRPKKNATKLMDDSKKLESILTELKDLDKEVDFKTYQELEKLLHHFINTERADKKQFISGLKESVTSEPVNTKEPVESKPAPAEIDSDDLDDLEKELLAAL